MESFFQTLLPVVTLMLGYLLNVWVGSVESRRDIERRRIGEKERAYALIIGKLHDLFETYRIQTLKTTTNITGTPLWGNPDGHLMPQKYDELMGLVFENSLYLTPDVIQALIDLKLNDFRARINRDPKETKIDHIDFLETHADNMWKEAKTIINEMRREIGLEEYPEDLLAMWR
jgi:hypothetical protein